MKRQKVLFCMIGLQARGWAELQGGPSGASPTIFEIQWWDSLHSAHPATTWIGPYRCFSQGDIGVPASEAFGRSLKGGVLPACTSYKLRCVAFAASTNSG